MRTHFRSKILCAALAGVLWSGAGLAQTYKEAPALAALVQAGSLPPVAQRLPTTPRVIEVVEEIGRYGGTWRAGLRGGNDQNWLFRAMGYEPLMAWDREFSGKVVPNVASEMVISPDSRAFRFKLRAGMKWSDGKPYTAHDIAFFINDVAQNKDLFPVVPGWLTAGGQPASIEVHNDHDFTIRFAEPNGLFPYFVARGRGVQLNNYPAHYCRQFHPKYNAEGLPALLRQAGSNNWVDLFVKRCTTDPEQVDRWQNPERPSIEAWTIRRPYTGGATVVTLERNPFYFKVDAAGNQLPYIDQLRFDVGNDVESLVLKALNGEIDYQDRHINKLSNRAVFADGARRGNYRLVDTPTLYEISVAIGLNLNHSDPVLRDVFRNKNFRIALSHALDRKAIIDTVFIGNGEPKQPAPNRGTPFYHERLATQYTDHDKAKANALLDAILPRKDSRGIRLAANGQPLTINLMVIPTLSDFVDIGQLVVEYWRAVGIDAKLQTVDRSVFYDRKNKAEHDAAMWTGAAGGLDILTDARWILPFSDESLFAVKWANWANGLQTTIKEEPPEDVKRKIALFNSLKGAGTLADQQAIMKQVLDMSADFFPAIGISSAPTQFAVVKNDLRNVPAHPFSWAYPSPAPANPEQFFFKR